MTKTDRETPPEVKPIEYCVICGRKLKNEESLIGVCNECFLLEAYDLC